jgi:tetratricopeptide (TPR) repeat protein
MGSIRMPSQTDPKGGFAMRLFALALGFEVANAAYLAAFDSATIFYHAMVVAHVVVGLFLLPLSLGLCVRWLRLRTLLRTWGAAVRVAAAGSALVAVGTALKLAVVGTATPYRHLLTTHIASSCLALGLTVVAAFLASPDAQGGARRAAVLLGLALAFTLVVRGAAWIWPAHVAKIENPITPPLTSDDEGGGRDGRFFPSSVTTIGDRTVPDDFFLESKACGNKGCHPDITKQWDSSMHHFSSFNNQWYRKSIEYMQEVVGTKPSKWCGGCHDQSVLLTGRMDTPIVQQIDTPQAQAGIGCLVCHSIVHVKDTMGQGGYVLEYPEMHKLVASKNRALHAMHDYMVRLDPGPHKATMLKPFHRESRAEFCSSCHKVHLDVPVNHYRWFRGFNEYDAWQGSGVSGQGARAFYYPDKPKDCADCHMPLVKSADAANRNGFVHSHRFPAANTAVPFANGDTEQLKIVQDFLKANIVSVDVFAVTESAATTAEPAAHPAAGGQAVDLEGPRAQAMFPDVEEAMSGPAGGLVPAAARERAAVVAPLNRAAAFMRPGGTYRVDVVARTRGVGHFFPGGTVDAFDVWLELKGEDARGSVFYWSGAVADGGRGPVEPGAHRYRSLQVDGHGNPINKRNAWSTRALMYARLIPPGAADVGRYRVTVPGDAQGPLTFTARMNYRKFSWWNTRFSYAGVRDPAQPKFDLTPDFDDGRFVFTGDTSRVSGRLKEVPDLPITVVAEDQVKVELAPAGGALRAALAAAVPADQAFDRERFNDYGIGLLLQGDFVGAKRAFEHVNRLDPKYAAGFVNLGRVLVLEGDHDAAIPVLEQALKIDPNIASGHYFLALALKARGRYDEALDHLRAAAARFPRDKVVRAQIGRLLFLKRKMPEAIAEFEQALRVDPEDLTSHYNLMLCYRALGDAGKEKREEALYTRFKADEASQATTGDYRRLNPEDNLERQPIHEHAGIPLFESGKAGR